jgi:S-adenosylmethionine:tRNA ribosyltransferase-isomerase
MSPAVWPRSPGEERLLVADVPARQLEERRMSELPEVLHPGDLLVVNDAATLPASLAGEYAGAPVEVRLAGAREDGAWDAVLLGAGDWRARTEDRPPPPRLAPGARIAFADDLVAVVELVSPLSPRLVTLRFAGAADGIVGALYRVGRPVQYAHVRAPLELSQVQTAYAARPWAAEMPSAGRPLTWEILRALRSRGVALAALTHAAGLSSTGDAALDAALPLPERFEIPERTAAAVSAAHARGARVIAVGTTVVRALEGSAAAHGGRVVGGRGATDLRIGAGFEPSVVDALLTGVHEPGTSHHRLMRALATPELLDRALALAEARGFLGHEFGDAMLVLGVPRAAERRAA